MKIFIVVYINEFRRQRNFAVFTVKELAENFIKETEKQYPFCHYGSFHIQEWETDGTMVDAYKYEFIV